MMCGFSEVNVDLAVHSRSALSAQFVLCDEKVTLWIIKGYHFEAFMSIVEELSINDLTANFGLKYACLLNEMSM
jgi:hypothetical protein